MNKKAHRYCSDNSSTCSTCQTDVKDEDHIIKCRTQRRYNLRVEWIHSINKFLSGIYTPNAVKTSICYNLSKWLEPTKSQEEMNQNNNGCEAINRAEGMQEKIGWQQFIRGKISIQWGKVIRTHLETQGIKSITAEKWGSTLLQINWKFMLALWTLRNEQNNGGTTKECTKKNKQKLIDQLEGIKQRNWDLPQSLLAMIETRDRTIPQLQAQVQGAFIVERVNNNRKRSLTENGGQGSIQWGESVEKDFSNNKMKKIAPAFKSNFGKGRSTA
jgi:hypothetical protein